MGWPAVARVWLPAWLSDPEGVVRELVDRAARLGGGAPAVGEVSSSTSWQTYEQSADGPNEPSDPVDSRTRNRIRAVAISTGPLSPMDRPEEHELAAR